MEYHTPSPCSDIAATQTTSLAESEMLRPPHWYVGLISSAALASAAHTMTAPRAQRRSQACVGVGKLALSEVTQRAHVSHFQRRPTHRVKEVLKSLFSLVAELKTYSDADSCDSSSAGS
ncbi:hypothetical protein BDV96DRAFT_602874 [Lophiotrema nucula]|uniref:Uncharacterized protein n=1 Tax=Lophiotrema nucula TaxID=690887 RepID=A0A6A5Z0C2_9PLEO|nr:hypothetical protein BDV96DRAFT_602874 [Lophiotrema nucula]